MPSINDPSIYAIRCTPGREKELVRKLYEKREHSRDKETRWIY